MSMLYVGDTETLTFSLSHSDGSSPSVTVSPLITIIQVSTTTSVVSSAPMTFLTGTVKTYYYNFVTTGLTPGFYVAVVSYAADGNTVNNLFLQNIKLGDTYITGPVALASTVALNATVALAATTATPAQVAAVNPNSSSVVLAIQSKVNTLPTSPADNSLLTTVKNLVTDVKDATLGTWNINKAVTPNTLTYLRTDGSTAFASFNLSEGSTSSQKTNTVYIPSS
jgi:hypothetical protein